MKRSLCFWLAMLMTIAAATVAAAQSQTQSLGDYARAVKKTKTPPAAKVSPKVYDNDNLPTSSSLSVVGKVTAEPTAGQNSDQTKEQAKDQGKDKSKDADAQAKQQGKSDEKKTETQLKPGQSAEDRQKALAAWKQKLDSQKEQVSLASRELDVLQREYQLKAAEFYADAARRTQNPNGFVEEDGKYKQQIADKQKAVDEAKAKLTGMEEEARKSGAPNSITE
jgi:hypothetical protein